jgi:hypothetical protein
MLTLLIDCELTLRKLGHCGGKAGISRDRLTIAIYESMSK